MANLVRVALNLTQARALLQLAQEADLDTFESCGFSERMAEIMSQAGLDAMSLLATAIGDAERRASRRSARKI